MEISIGDGNLLGFNIKNGVEMGQEQSSENEDSFEGSKVVNIGNDEESGSLTEFSSVLLGSEGEFTSFSVV